jgi:predicted double-glycine peptidase
MMLKIFRMIGFVVFVALCSAAQPAFPFESTKSSPDPYCGAKCLYVILLEQGAAPVSYKAFTKELGPASKEGYSLLQLQNAARSRGLFAESYRLEAEDLKLIGKDPAVILHMNPDHFVICSNYSNGQLAIYNAATGMFYIESPRFLEKWTGNTLLVSKNEIKLPGSPPKPPFQWWWVAFGVILVGCAASLLTRFMVRRSAILLIAITPCVGGCEKHPPNRLESTTITVESPSKTDSKKAPNVWIEKSSVDVGRLNLTPAPQMVSIPIQNRESTPIEITDVQISSSCLTGRISSKTIQPAATESLELFLARSKAGPQNAICTVMCNGHPVASVTVSWTVIAQLSLTPESIADLELKAGETKEIAIEIDVYNKQPPPKIQVECVWNGGSGLQTRGIEVSTRMVESTCLVTFSADAKALRQTVSGGLWVRLADQAEPAGIVPFMASVRTDINVSPSQLFLTSRDAEIMTAQILIETEELASLNPFELHWIRGDNRSQCNFTFEDQDGIKIVDLQANPIEIDGVTELEITAGNGFVKRIPAFFPKNK